MQSVSREFSSRRRAVRWPRNARGFRSAGDVTLSCADSRLDAREWDNIQSFAWFRDHRHQRRLPVALWCVIRDCSVWPGGAQLVSEVEDVHEADSIGLFYYDRHLVSKLEPA